MANLADDEILSHSVARAIMAEEVRDNLLERIDTAMRVLSGTGLPDPTPAAEIIEAWLDGLNWREIEGDALAGDMTEPNTVRWLRALKARLPQ